MIIVITGTPGTGKTLVAKAIAKQLDYKIINEKRFCKQHDIGTLVNGELIVPLSKLRRALNAHYKKENVIIEGHMLSNTPIKADLVIVLRTNPTVLETRLRKRRYTKAKISDNLMSEILDYCTIHAEQNYSKKIIHEIDTSNKTLSKTVKTALNIIAGKYDGDKVDWSGKLTQILAKDINKKLNI